MPSKGQIIEDKFTKNVYEFVETAEDTKGEFVKCKMTLKEKGIRKYIEMLILIGNGMKISVPSH